MDAKSLREKMKEKATRLAGGKDEVPGSTTWTPAEPMNTEYKTGARPISKQNLKTGGKVQGETAKHHAGRVARKSGGKVDKIGNDIINRNVKDANEDREGKKHIGGWKKGGRTGKLYGGGLYGMENQHTKDAFKKGGKVKKDAGGIILNDKDIRSKPGVAGVMPATTAPVDSKRTAPVVTADAAQKSKNDPVYMVHSAIQGGRGWVPKDVAPSLAGPGKNFEGMVRTVDAPKGSTTPPSARAGRQDGGRTKGKTNINIIIAPQGGNKDAAPPVMDAPPPMDMPPMPMKPPIAAGPPMGMPPGPPAGLEAALAMPRKDGGKVIHMDHGAGGGLGRLEKIKKYGKNA